MPELPEVETVVRALAPDVVGRTIVDYHNDWPRRITSHADGAALRDQLRGQQILAVQRRAKYIVVPLSVDTLILHLRMSGHLSVQPATAPADPYVHDVFVLDDGRELRFRDPRKFGTVCLLGDPTLVLGKLGPEPLDEAFTPAELAARLHNRRTAIKPLLLDQTVLAGVGNIYADEALFEAGIDPRRPAAGLTADEIVRLHAGIRAALARGITREGASITTYLKPNGEKGSMQEAVNVFRRTDEPCYVCATPIVRIRLAQRSTHFCPHCQR